VYKKSVIVWDEPKRLSNLRPEPDGHGMDFADARDRFEWGTATIAPTYPAEEGRERFMAIGFLDGDLVSLVFSHLGSEAISLISLRTASNKERKRYAKV
jgi:uncharacterized DUF497 family protein